MERKKRGDEGEREKERERKGVSIDKEQICPKHIASYQVGGSKMTTQGGVGSL